MLPFACLSQSQPRTLFSNNAQTHHGFFVAPTIKITRLNDETALMPGLRAAWVINRSVALGFDAYGLVPTIEDPTIVPGMDVRPLLGYGGLFVEPILWSNRMVHFSFPVSFGAGWFGYVEDWDDDEFNLGGSRSLIDDEVFWVIEPGANAELNVASFLRLSLGVSYRIVEDLSIRNTEPDALRGFNTNFSLKFGRF
ncbi:MAG: hypothetical protein OHK0053_31400 [Microscillaceae bacterium]